MKMPWQHKSGLFYARKEELRTCKMANDGDFDEHVKLMQNKVKSARDVGATILDGQFRVILLSSLPIDWDSEMTNVPGTTTEAEAKEIKLKALLATVVANTTTTSTGNANRRDRPLPGRPCTNQGCPKPATILTATHATKDCWAPGGANRQGMGATLAQGLSRVPLPMLSKRLQPKHMS
ncbi:hypothetical protein J3R30DRAFT_3491676 [Lentinula aciculospora]|uniref:Uncharacterized protein n=1 Tax=Lentinula aciculospora TaxID=153920 RepID=A0A9W9DLJ8_9AGAR|nr:hypothetical protein J3R30DRAFT_3491676 [Lentinula aciculospora]